VIEIIVSVVGVIGLIAVALIQRESRAAKAMWEENKTDHNYVVEKIEVLGKSLGRSIDRNASALERVEGKLDTHIRDHAVGDL
jgi:hypothetical protein